MAQNGKLRRAETLNFMEKQRKSTKESNLQQNNRNKPRKNNKLNKILPWSLKMNLRLIPMHKDKKKKMSIKK